MKNWFKAPHDEVVSARHAAAVEACLAISLVYCSPIHPDNDIPFYVMEGLVDGVVSDAGTRKHPAIEALRSLIKPGEMFEARVPVNSIQGVLQVNGPFAFNIARLPEQMNLCPGDAFAHVETFGPLDQAEGERLWQSIQTQLVGSERDIFPLAHQTWDDCYIILNHHGASHRLALWWRLQQFVDIHKRCLPRVEEVSARVTPYHLDASALDHLCHTDRVLFCKDDPHLDVAFEALQAVDPRYLYLPPKRGPGGRGSDVPAMMVLPQMAEVVAARRADSLALHRWADPLFDIGRYFLERRATYRHGVR
ncbi:hypothetical protein [Sphingomonas sp. PR090111-T3T-6A]|uniref:hypothetical protein n=1 Tax=Sphingomonas sp. PR090111-T3T-6A TaxID=685778 RepID=UPI00036E473C|nr:hypothetical protein [Sphingomonas sp. PR090111-T3T-6A]